MAKLSPVTPPQSWALRWLPALLLGSAVGLIVVLVLMLNTSTQDALDADGSPAEMVWIPGGTFVMGSNTSAEPDEKPAHEVTVNGFHMNKTEVTNGQFAAFVVATGYKTIAEQKPDPRKYPGADPKNLVPGSAMFVSVEASLMPPWPNGHPPWWKYQAGASWRHPDGPKSPLYKTNYPAVHIAWDDAVAYCKWAGARLPTEAEWEYAARGGLKQQSYTWGTSAQGTDGKWYANTFQGKFPHLDTGEDGFAGLAPVGQFPPNGYGLYDISGNVWEWCDDIYSSTYYASSPKENPRGPTTGDLDGGEMQRVRRGGSYLCADSYCKRYIPNARDKNPADSGASHTGFRCVKD